MCVLPLVFVFSISITSEQALQAGGYHIIPQEFSNAAYMFLWNERGTILLEHSLLVLIAVIGTVIAVCLTTTMGYVASRRNFKLKKLYTWIIFIPMVFNGGMSASYVVVNNILNLRDTIWAVILPLACSSFSVTICRTFFRTTAPGRFDLKQQRSMQPDSSRILSGIAISDFQTGYGYHWYVRSIRILE